MTFWARGATILALAVLTGCGLPRSGPSRNEILQYDIQNGGDTFIIPVDDRVAAATRELTPLGFSSAFLNAGTTQVDVIRPGDVLAITVWENVENGLLASVGQKVTNLAEVQVDSGGGIFIPYAGRITASGRTPDQLRRQITRLLDEQTPDPQVEVRRVAGDGSSITIIGGVAAQGTYPIEQPTTRLASMLARAGGVTVEQDVAQVRIQRGGQTGRVWLEDLYDTPAADIALRPGDRIIVEEDRRAFTSLGATGQQTVVPFSSRDLSALEAIASVGGLQTALADPTGIFVFREEASFTANRVLGRGDIQTPQRFAYIIDLTAPGGMFTARDFIIRDGDTIYVTEAPFVQFSKVISAILGTTGAAGGIAATATGVNDLGG